MSISYQVGYALPVDYPKELTKCLLDSCKKIKEGSIVFFETLDDPNHKKPDTIFFAFDEAKAQIAHILAATSSCQQMIRPAGCCSFVF